MTCAHDDSQQTRTGTWRTPEITKAMDVGYRVISIAEGWHFPKLKCGPFIEYIDKFLKMKTEARGCPAFVSAEKERMDYLRQMELKKGTQLQEDKKMVNQWSARFIKLCLNR